MRIRLHDTLDQVQAYAAVLRGAFTVTEESDNYPDRGTSLKVRRYLDIALPTAVAARVPSPLELATDAKHRRDLADEISILTNAGNDLEAQPWYPLVAGDVVLMTVGVDADLGETYIAEADEYEDVVLRRVSATHHVGPAAAGEWPIPFYDLWFEAGPAALTVIRAGAVVHGTPAGRIVQA
jgi:hypothetical protein